MTRSRELYLMRAIVSGRLHFSKSDMRGFIYDTEQVNDYGKEITLDGKHHPWPCYCYRNRLDDSTITTKEYRQLSPGKQIAYYKVKCLKVEVECLDAEGKPTVKTEYLYEDADLTAINALFAQLVQIGDPAERELFMIADRSSPDQTPMLVAGSDNGFIAHSPDQTPMLVAGSDKGFITGEASATLAEMGKSYEQKCMRQGDVFRQCDHEHCEGHCGCCNEDTIRQHEFETGSGRYEGIC